MGSMHFVLIRRVLFTWARELSCIPMWRLRMGRFGAPMAAFSGMRGQRHHLERTAQLSIPNPWGIAFDEWGQNFFAETSSPDVRWMMPGTVKPRYGVATHKSYDLIEEAHRVRPTSGLEFVSSRHFPDDVQGDLLINNTIGFLG